MKKVPQSGLLQTPVDGKIPKCCTLFAAGLVMQHNMHGDKKNDMVIGAV